MTMLTRAVLTETCNQLLLDLDQLLRRHLRGDVHAKISLRVLLRRLHLAELLLVFVEHHPLVGNRYLRRDHNRKTDRHQLAQDARICPIGRRLQTDEAPKHPVDVEVGLGLAQNADRWQAARAQRCSASPPVFALSGLRSGSIGLIARLISRKRSLRGSSAPARARRLSSPTRCRR